MLYRIAAAVVLGISLASPADAATDHDKMEKLLKKYGSEFGSTFSGAEISEALAKANTPCICHDLALSERLGFIVYYDFEVFSADCLLPMFGPDGSLNGATACSDYSPLGK